MACLSISWSTPLLYLLYVIFSVVKDSKYKNIFIINPKNHFILHLCHNSFPVSLRTQITVMAYRELVWII